MHPVITHFRSSSGFDWYVLSTDIRVVTSKILLRDWGMISTVGKHGVVINILLYLKFLFWCGHRPTVYCTRMHMILRINFSAISPSIIFSFNSRDAYLSDQEGFLFSAKAAIPEDASVRSDYWKKGEMINLPSFWSLVAKSCWNNLLSSLRPCSRGRSRAT